MNDDKYANACQDPNAKACIYLINATQTLNSDIAINFRKALVENRIDFLINYNVAKEDILNNNRDYIEAFDENTQIELENHS